MDVGKFTDKIQEPIRDHAEINIEKICNDPSTSPQAMLASILWNMFNRITDVCVKLGIARGKLSLVAIQAGFNNANETATAGLFQLGGGAVLAGTGVAQGVAGCKSATELAQAAELRNNQIAEIKERTMQPEEVSLTENSGITVKVEAFDEPVTSGLDEVEEEIFYDAEETLSCKQTKPEEQSEEAQLAEKATVQNKITEKKADELIEKANREYDVSKDLINAETSKTQGLGVLGQGLFHISQGLGDVEKAKGQKETIQREMAQDNQNQLGNTAEDLKRKADKMAEFDPFRSNSSSLKA